MGFQETSVETLLGVGRPTDDTRRGLADSIQDGLPVSALYRLADLIAPGDPAFRFHLVVLVCDRIGDPAGAYPIYDAEGSRLCPGTRPRAR